MQYIKIKPKVVREVSKYLFRDYMNDFPDGTLEKFTEITGKKPKRTEIRDYEKSIQPKNENGAD